MNRSRIAHGIGRCVRGCLLLSLLVSILLLSPHRTVPQRVEMPPESIAHAAPATASNEPADSKSIEPKKIVELPDPAPALVVRRFEREPNGKRPDFVGPPIAMPIIAKAGGALERYEEALPAGALVRMGSTRFRHPTEIHTNLTMGGKYLVTWSGPKLILTNLQTGQRELTANIGLKSESVFRRRVCVSPDGRRLAAIDILPAEDETLVGRIWELQSDPQPRLTELGAIRLPRGKRDYFYFGKLFFSANSKNLYLVGSKTCSLINAADGALLRHISTEEEILDVAPSSNRVLTGKSEFFDRFIVGSFMTFTTRYHFRPRKKPAKPEVESRFRMSFLNEAENNNEIAYQPLKVIDLMNGGHVATITVPHVEDSFDRSRRISPDGRFVSSSFRGELLIWEVATGHRVLRVAAAPEGKKSTWSSRLRADFSADGTRFIAVSDDAERHFDLETFREVPPHATNKRAEHRGSNGLLDELFYLGPRSDRPEPLAILDRSPIDESPIAVTAGYAGTVMSVSPSGEFIAVGDRTGRLDVWSIDGRLVANLLSKGPPILSIDFSADGSRIAASDKGRVIHLWSTGTWQKTCELDVPCDHDSLFPEQVFFAPDGKHLLIRSGAIKAFWEVGSQRWIWDSGGHIGSDHSHYPAPWFAPDGKEMALDGRWIDLRTGQETFTHDFDLPRKENRGDLTAIASSPDGTTLATVHDRKDIQLWDATTRTVIRQFPASAAIEAKPGILRFSPDGRRLATCDNRGRARIWETATGELMHTLEYPDGAIDDLRFGKDSRTLITSNHREVIVWRLRPANLRMPEGGIERCWEMLGSSIVADAERARWLLLDNPKAAVELARAKLPPGKAIDAAEVRRWIQALDSRSFAERRRAEVALRGYGQRVLPLLTESQKLASDEVNRRLASLIAEMKPGPTYYERTRIRAVELLELIGASEAWAQIESWAAGDASCILTEQARQALARKK